MQTEPMVNWIIVDQAVLMLLKVLGYILKVKIRMLGPKHMNPVEWLKVWVKKEILILKRAKTLKVTR